MKKRKEDLTDGEFMKTLDTLYTAAGTVSGRNAMKTFLRELLTESERIMLGRRIWIARLLMRGETYDSIREKLKVSTRTIYRIERWLGEQFKGLKGALKGLEGAMDARAIRREIAENPWSAAAMKKRYPLYYLLFPNPKPKKQYRD